MVAFCKSKNQRASCSSSTFSDLTNGSVGAVVGIATVALFLFNRLLAIPNNSLPFMLKLSSCPNFFVALLKSAWHTFHMPQMLFSWVVHYHIRH